MTDDAQAKVDTQRYATPTFDELKPKMQDLVRAYCQCFDKEEAAERAGYRNAIPSKRREKMNELFADPRVIKAIDELLAAKLEDIGQSRAAVCQRLLAQSLASIDDVCELVLFRNAKGESLGRHIWTPKDPAKVDPRFLPALSLIHQNRDGGYSWDNMGQHRATKMLSELMLWDQEELDNTPVINFHFGAIQDEPYEKPKGGADTSFLKNDDDEIDRLTDN